MIIKIQIGERIYYVKAENRTIAVGKKPRTGNMAATAAVRELMKCTGLKATGSWTNINSDNGEWVVSAVYQIPFWMPRRFALKRVYGAIFNSALPTNK